MPSRSAGGSMFDTGRRDRGPYHAELFCDSGLPPSGSARLRLVSTRLQLPIDAPIEVSVLEPQHEGAAGEYHPWRELLLPSERATPSAGTGDQLEHQNINYRHGSNHAHALP